MAHPVLPPAAMIRSGAILFVAGLGVLAGCGAEDPDTDSADLKAKTLVVPPGDSVEFSTTTSGSILVTVDCSPPLDPDDVGPVFSVSAPDLEATDPDAMDAGYWSWAGHTDTGKHAVTVRNEGDETAKCKASVKKRTASAASSCPAWTVRRSPNTNHTHIPVGADASSDWEELPASGNHWGAWAAWNTIYPRAVKRGFLLHNLEHGGVVLSYRCKTADESAKCADAENALLDLANAFGKGRVILTPDPTQPTEFAVRTWRWVYAGDCLDTSAVLDFLAKHYRHGREDIDADPPIPFDPTTTKVPCQDLMAAPDSCN